jgi:uncharacterized protein (TIGR03118 family)
MKTSSLSFHSTQLGRRFAAALFVAGLDLSLVAFPIGSLRAGEDERNAFNWKNLQSDIGGVADRTDPNLSNAWGLVIHPTAKVFWVNDNATGVSTLFHPDGSPMLLPSRPPQNFVTLPLTAGDKASMPPATAAAPTGIVFNPSSSSPNSNVFLIRGPKSPATFIFDGEDGGIWAWNPGVSLTEAILVRDNSTSPSLADSSVYKGLTLANRSSGDPTLYAANFRHGTVDIFNSSFQPVTIPGAFRDPTLPTGYAPFGIATIDNLIYVTFAKQNDSKHDDVSGAGHGFVDVFDTNGVLLKHLIKGGQLNSPWGLARVPREFGKFGHDVLLVGNFGDGMINAFNIHTGAFLGSLLHRPNQPLEFDDLWALFFFDDKLYFTAGIVDESHGLFGVIRPAGEDEDNHD